MNHILLANSNRDIMMSYDLSIDQFSSVLPKQFKGNLTPQVMDEINTAISDDHHKEAFRDNLISYTSVMAEGKFKLSTYIDAVRYVSFKLLGSTNLIAHKRAFPDKHRLWLSTGVSGKDINSYVSAFNKSKIVNLIMAQTMVPTHVLNADFFQKAINTQVDIMMDDDVSPKVRSDAANSLMTHLKAPEAIKVELDVGVKQDNTIGDLAATIRKLTESSKEKIINGDMTAQQVAHMPLTLENAE